MEAQGERERERKKEGSWCLSSLWWLSVLRSWEPLGTSQVLGQKGGLCISPTGGRGVHVGTSNTLRL